MNHFIIIIIIILNYNQSLIDSSKTFFYYSNCFQPSNDLNEDNGRKFRLYCII